MDYYRDLLNRAEQLPDIITCRRFSLNDAAPLAEHLMDLSTTEVAGTFYSSYLNNNQEPDGAIRWLPMCAEVDGTAANVDLFAQYNIPLPTNYAEFVAAINAFELSASRAIRQTGGMTTPVWKPCRAALSRS